MKRDRSRAVRWAAIALVAMSPACDGAETEPVTAGGVDAGADEAFGGGDIVAAAARSGGADGEAPAAVAPRRVYYDLTVFEWYRRGEPLRVGGGAYLPTGKPRAIPAERMERVGEYLGVDVYVLEGSQPPYGAVFVPVFRRYWQPFVLQHRAPVHAD